MSKKKSYTVPANIAKNAHINEKKYRALYQRSIKDPAGFWGDQAKEFISWSAPWVAVTRGDFNT